MNVGKALAVGCFAICIANDPVLAGQSEPEPVPSNSIEAVFRIAPGFYSGGEPRGAQAFRQLSRLGVKTVISVDGSRPDLVSARANGIRYIHIPMSYGAWSPTNQWQLVAAGKLASGTGPMFIHCHHGRHRGPTAVALIGMGLNDWSIEQALSWLKVAGTSTNYHGLFETVNQFKIPEDTQFEVIAPVFPESVIPAGIVESMLANDRTWENLKLISESSEMDKQHLVNELLLLLESFRELERLPEAREKGAAFLKQVGEAIRNSEAIHFDLVAGRPLVPSMKSQLGKTCSGCHQRFRD